MGVTVLSWPEVSEGAPAPHRIRQHSSERHSGAQRDAEGNAGIPSTESLDVTLVDIDLWRFNLKSDGTHEWKMYAESEGQPGKLVPAEAVLTNGQDLTQTITFPGAAAAMAPMASVASEWGASDVPFLTPEERLMGAQSNWWGPDTVPWGI